MGHQAGGGVGGGRGEVAPLARLEPQETAASIRTRARRGHGQAAPRHHQWSPVYVCVCV